MSPDFKYNYAQIARESGFLLRSCKNGHLDWRLIGHVEIERLLREQNLEQIDSVVDHLSEVPLRSLLETNILDTGISKYFILSQFSIQYLLFCRKFLEEAVLKLKQHLQSAEKEVDTLKSSLSDSNMEILQLHKKITQMEAIREVIYPCHLCSKNFISNDSLNMHIARKHNANYETRTETPVTLAKDDLALINTIKLELEIKHLKERLNIAERKMKEHNDPVNSKACNKILKHSVGVQSDLLEIKENDESVNNDCNNCSENMGYIPILHSNLLELKVLREEQKIQNCNLLADIDNKLRDLSQSLKISQDELDAKLQTNKISASTSEEIFEILLSRKIEEIGKTTAAILSDAMNKMQMSYTSKLEQLENKLYKITKYAYFSDDPREVMNVEKQNTIGEINFDNAKAQRIGDVTLQEQPTPLLNDNNSAINLIDSSKTDINLAVCSSESIEKTITLTNHTDINACKSIVQEFQDTSKTKDNKLRRYVKSHDTMQTFTQNPVTRKDLYVMVNSILLALNVDTRTKWMDQSTMERVSSQLSERRNLLKDRHHNFYATRNNIKKFVDKLCSMKMPRKAATVLKATRVVKREKECEEQINSQNDYLPHNEGYKLIGQINIPPSPSAAQDSELRQANKLPSPMKKMEMKHERNSTRTKGPSEPKPVPLPRKRVMFNRDHINED